MIQNDLVKAGAIDPNEIHLFHIGARDDPDAKFFRCGGSGAIILPNYYVGEDEYTKKSHRQKIVSLIGDSEHERDRDNLRREQSLSEYYLNKRVLDFGCGLGDFARRINRRASQIYAYDLDLRCVDSLVADGFHGVSALTQIEDNSLDTIFLFHVLEHIVNPLDILSSLKSKLRSSGKIVIEVPHANDLLFHLPRLDEFRNFSLWTQHVALYTESSLNSLIKHVGFDMREVQFIQRYNYYNHLKWFLEKAPGGHKDPSYTNNNFGSSFLLEYNKTLINTKQTDTILIVGEKNAQNL